MNRAARVLLVLLGLLTAAAGGAPAVRAQAAAPEIVLAQAEQGKRPGIFRFLFRNRRERAEPRREFQLIPRRERRAAPASREEPRKQTRQRRQERQAATPGKQRKQRKNRPAVAAAPPEPEVVTKAENAKRVLVMGDFMAAALAKGLDSAFAENANVVVIDASKGDSGLVRADYYDWAAQVPVLVEEQKPDAILMLIGSNDRQAINTDAGPRAPGSDGWRAAYSARVSALAEALKATTKPIFWAGLAPVKSGAMSRDYSAFNGIVREQLETKNMRYVDIWNGFADEEGKFVGAGPDVSGQSVQLRNSDGLNFTRAGQRKLAFFFERDLNELLGTAPALAAAAGAATPANVEPADQAPRIGPMIPLDTLTVGGETLSVGAAATSPESGAIAATVSQRLVGAGQGATPAGRADNFAWPAVTPVATAPGAAPAAAAGPVAAPAPVSVIAAPPTGGAAPAAAVPPVTPAAATP